MAIYLNYLRHNVVNIDGEKSKLLHQTKDMTNVVITFIHFYKHCTNGGNLARTNVPAGRSYIINKVIERTGVDVQYCQKSEML